jgi:excisionase family DNA binding protein
MENPGNDRLIKAAEVAQILQISKSQAYRLMMTELPCVRFGSGTVRVKSEDLQRYIAAHTDTHAELQSELVREENESAAA